MRWTDNEREKEIEEKENAGYIRASIEANTKHIVSKTYEEKESAFFFKPFRNEKQNQYLQIQIKRRKKTNRFKQSYTRLLSSVADI